MSRAKIQLIVLVALLCSLAGCRSAKEVTKTGTPIGRDSWLEKVTDGKLKEGTLTSKLNLELVAGDKAVSVGGSCNLKRGELVQLSLVALGFMEVGRLEFTPQYMMMVDRMGRQYMKASYDEVPFMVQAGADFYAIQALFWNTLFVPGKGENWTEQDFEVTQVGEQTIFKSKGEGMLQCQFVVDALTGLIRNTTVAAMEQNKIPALNWTYLHFTEVSGSSFPDKMQISMGKAGKSYRLSVSLSSLKVNAKEVKPTEEPGGKYKKVEIQDILNQLMKL